MSNTENLESRKIRLAQSEHASAVIELMKDCAQQVPILAETQWGTCVNAIVLDTQSTMIQNMVNLLEKIKRGELNNK
jgi:hypothetical protein